MAILQQIQKRTGFLIMIIALALFAFIIQGLIKNSSTIGKGNSTAVAEIGGRKISRDEFQKEVALLQKQNPRISNMQAVKAIWDRTVREGVLNNQFDELGIEVGPERMRTLIVENASIKQAFTNKQGVFDQTALLEYMNNVEKGKTSNPELYSQWQSFKKNLREAEKEKIYMNLVKTGLNPTIKEGEKAYHYENDKVNFKFAAVSYGSIPDSTVTVSKEDINNYVSKHADQYKVDESRDIEYVFIPLVPSQDDKDEVVKKLKDLINDKTVLKDNKEVVEKGLKNTEDADAFAQLHSDVKQPARWMFKNQLPNGYADKIINLNEGDVYGPYAVNNQVYLTKVLASKMMPDSAKASHILIAYKGSRSAKPETTRTKEEAKKKADSILKIVKRNGSKFADYAKELSEGPTKTKGGDLGWFTYGRMVPEFNDFIFTGSKGKMGVVETQFGFHVIKIDDIKAPKKAVKVVNIIRNVEPSNKTENQIFANAAKFASEANGNENFSKLAKDKGYQAKPIQKIGRYEDNLAGIGKNREVVRWAYKKDRKNGDVAKFDTDKGHVIVYLTAKKDKGLMSAEEASPLVKSILLKEKKAEIIKKKMTGNTLAEIAKNSDGKVGMANGVNLKSPVVPGFGKEPKVAAKAFAQAPDAISKPIAGERGVFVVKTIKIEKAADIKNYIPYVEKLKKELQAGISKKVVDALKEKEDIEDNRAMIYQ